METICSSAECMCSYGDVVFSLVSGIKPSPFCPKIRKRWKCREDDWEAELDLRLVHCLFLLCFINQINKRSLGKITGVCFHEIKQQGKARFLNQQVCLAKCWRKARKSTSCIHPELLAEPVELMGPFLTKWSWNFFLGKMKYGGMQLPCALTARAMVTKVPLSPEVTAPTWRFPLVAIIFSWHLDRCGTWNLIINFDELSWTFVSVYIPRCVCIVSVCI